MAHQFLQQTSSSPLPAKAYLNYFQQITAKRHGLSAARSISNARINSSPEHTTQLPTLLGSRFNCPMHSASKSDDSPYTTPTTASVGRSVSGISAGSSATPTTASFGRSVSGISSESSTSSNWDEFQKTHSTSSWKLEVRKTFINVAEISDEKPCPGLMRHKSEPIICSTQSAPLTSIQASLSQIRASQDAWKSLPLPRTPWEADMQPSIGSALHGSGSCKPCAWFWKIAGCANGVDCRHCHLCPQDEMKRRRKANHQTRRRKSLPQSESASLEQD